ncbi:uncharacterized protein BXIN_1324 [Babesia sp. Xinjiang]|uniref:uncharacterized protein n=1 Tax=Babesia sp. Xinjiang TaxID=462227 RepID=UPI000A23AE36|nr:uncharacterized protein BXIN_1324 [Babesia sp. Xinjiang]ORM40092.1 hypothetical protein BXIN_1324 [Babesia sp. Xinjiang]
MDVKETNVSSPASSEINSNPKIEEPSVDNQKDDIAIVDEGVALSGQESNVDVLTSISTTVRSPLSSILASLESVCERLDRLSESVQRLESSQGVILRRVSRKSGYNQFLID